MISADIATPYFDANAIPLSGIPPLHDGKVWDIGWLVGMALDDIVFCRKRVVVKPVVPKRKRRGGRRPHKGAVTKAEVEELTEEKMLMLMEAMA